MIDKFNLSSNWMLEYKDIAMIIGSFGQDERTLLFQECIGILREISRNGVFDQNNFKAKLRIEQNNHSNMRSVERALSFLKKNIEAINISKELAYIMFKILKPAIRANIVFNQQKTNIQLRNIENSIKPVAVFIDKGSVLLEANEKIDDEAYEVLFAYKQKLQLEDHVFLGFYNDFLSQFLLCTLTIAMCFVSSRMLSVRHKLSGKKYLFLFCVILANILLLRGFIQIGELGFFAKNFFLIYSLYCLAPIIFSTIISTLMCGVICGIFVSCIIAVFYTLMLFRTVDFYLTILLTNIFVIFVLKNSKVRGKIVKSGFFGGLLFALIIVVHGVTHQLTVDIYFWQSISAVVMGCYTGILALGALPIFEKYFAIFTDISLMDLTDYKNPLLKKMQVIVPGTYHHCLVVSNIAEQVAGYIGANPFVCKAGALFHDVGKISKAEYFIENQNNGVNLHNRQTPYISSLIIRNHVKDGIEIGKKHHLPPEIIDIIAEHHGTTLVKYFYNLAKAELIEAVKHENKSDDEIEKYVRENLDESVFRYDGPRPQSKESAIIMLADSVEAAGRSLKKVTHQSISNMIDDIFSVKLGERQFDECPITLAELQVLKKAFAFTLVNMLHPRISYASIVTPNKKNIEKKDLISPDDTSNSK